MKTGSFRPESILVAVFSKRKAGTTLGEKIARFIEDRGLRVSVFKLRDPALQEYLAEEKVDLMVALGGDGTMLRAGHICAPLDIPILGVNLGRFGFLTETKASGWKSALELVLEGSFWLEERMMLKAVHLRGEEILSSWDVINEAVIGRGSMVRPVHLKTSIDGVVITTYVADALIVSTATGSTTYALAVDGPILPPASRNILIVPVAPHLSLDRAIVLDERSKVVVEVDSAYDACLSVDGQVPDTLLDEDRVEVVAGEKSVKFVRMQESGFFYRKLMSLMNQNPAVGKKE